MYQKITGAIPAIGSARETETLDFKARVHKLSDGSADLLSIALPVAAFANRLGGTLLFGAAEGQLATLSGFAPLSPTETKTTIGACDNAIKERCTPAPLWSPSVLPVAGGELVAINVDPYPSALVSVRVSGDRAKGYGGDAYVFPTRVGSLTKYLTADQIPMFMNPKVRHTLLMLSRLNAGETVIVVAREGRRQHFPFQFRKIEEDLNVVHLSDRSFPLDLIESVWWDDKKWFISLPFMIGS